MTDLVQRLRGLYETGGANALKEAADEIERLRAEVAETKAERDEAVDWGAIVDRHGVDSFDALADQWLAMESIQRLNNAVTSVFSRWANDELMGRFKTHITNVMHQSFVEGCIVGVRAALSPSTQPDQ